jgi:hypothetical protein
VDTIYRIIPNLELPFNCQYICTNEVLLFIAL